MKQRQVSSGDFHTEVRQQIAALRQREVQVIVAELAQLTRYPQPVQPQRGIEAACQHQLGGLGRPAFDKIGHIPGDRGRRVMEVVNNDR
jgi:hypothetical protein